ncbi:hypothetical protein RB195_014214 [Necator americanus]|uniref:G-protein coupled receptors family 1 profile domain-containing protein n=2 Tax=Necator americanus TaxID=51031 RepID=A0ABR1DZM0_NECAM
MILRKFSFYRAGSTGICVPARKQDTEEFSKYGTGICSLNKFDGANLVASQHRKSLKNRTEMNISHFPLPKTTALSPSFSVDLPISLDDKRTNDSQMSNETLTEIQSISQERKSESEKLIRKWNLAAVVVVVGCAVNTVLFAVMTLLTAMMLNRIKYESLYMLLD